jgi:hypothetical protein
MPKAVGLMNPDNASKGAGPFKEGFLRIDSNSYKVHVAKAGDQGGDPPIPATKWSLQCTRLQENGEDVLMDEHDEPVKEELLFSFGTKSLPFVHPGKADGPDDDEPEDLGITVGAEGNTIYLVAADWKPNEKSSLMVLTRSMANQSIKPEFLNRCWCPDWNGCVFEMKTQAITGSDNKAINYKIVSKVIIGPGGKKAGKGATNGKANEAETVLAPILRSLSEELDGTAITRKAFLNRVRGALDQKGINSKLLVPALSLCKDDKWLLDHAETFDYILDPVESTITFGSVPTF